VTSSPASPTCVTVGIFRDVCGRLIRRSSDEEFGGRLAQPPLRRRGRGQRQADTPSLAIARMQNLRTTDVTVRLCGTPCQTSVLRSRMRATDS